MKYSITDYIASIFITILVYDTIPILLVIFKAKLRTWLIRTISILNYIVGVSLFSYYNYLLIGSFKYSTGAAFIWTLIGYWLMCKYCKFESKAPIANVTKTTDSENLPNNVINFHSSEKNTSDTPDEKVLTVEVKKSKRNYRFVICIITIIILAVYSCYSTYKCYVQKEALTIMANKYKKLKDKNSELQSEFDDLSFDYYNLENAYEVVYELYRTYYPFGE